jgi:ATP-dependent Lon protease
LTDDALREIIRSYTREAGVRNLEREIGNVCRKVARSVVGGRQAFSSRRLRPESLNTYLGVLRSSGTRQVHEKSEIGLVTGLAWTEVGGCILTDRGAGARRQGQADADRATRRRDAGVGAGGAELPALARHQAGLPRDFYRNVDIHVHVPEGAIPKDGPSAGITLATAMASALSKIPVRRDICMTGEITLRGKVLPIGGLKEKLLAAHRAGILEAMLPADKRKGSGRRAGKPARTR